MELILIIIIIALPVFASLYIKMCYSKYKNVYSSISISGEEVARKILDTNNLSNVDIKRTSGNLSDNYDPSNKQVNLSDEIFNGSSISSISVAAHECGHAVQDKEGYFFLKLRSSIYPVVRFTSAISYYIILIGLIAELTNIIYVGIILTCFGLLFQIVTLPVEFNASRRAIKMLVDYNIVTTEEVKGCKKVLRAAALTYVAGTIASLLQILRLILIANSRRD